MANEPMDSTLLDRAILFAVEAHKNTARRGKQLPYIVHPLEALTIAATLTDDQEVLAAAVLHDTTEDTDVTLETLKAEFGERVASFVETESDDISSGDSWQERKRKSAERLMAASHEAKIVALGDKLSNMRAIARDYAMQGESFWDLFHVKDKSVHAARYRGLVEALKEFSGTWAFEEFRELVAQVFFEES